MSPSQAGDSCEGLARGLSTRKVREGSPPPTGEIVKGEKGIDTLVPLAGYRFRKTKGISGVILPKIVEAIGELDNRSNPRRWALNIFN